MNEKQTMDGSEELTVGIRSLQRFVVQTIPVPPGTPARPRPDRPPLASPASSDAASTTEEAPPEKTV